jgi:hypothetical protein
MKEDLLFRNRGAPFLSRKRGALLLPETLDENLRNPLYYLPYLK